MQYTVEEVFKYVEEEDVKFIRLAFCDAFGVQKNISVMPGELKKAFEDGAPISAKEIAGFRGSPYAKLYLKPDPSTLAVLPWRPDSGRVLRMFCDVYTADGQEILSSTRNVLKKAVDAANKDENGNPTRIPYDTAGYMDIAPADRCENIRREICLTIEKMGLTPERSHHEHGPGQNEIDFHYGKPLKAADQMTTFKMVVSTIADRYGLVSDFSPVPLPGKPGNGYHINIYAVDKDGNDVAGYAAAGIMEKIREITLFLNPSNESYARFGNNMAPDKVNWSGAGESELMFVETYKGRTHVELRSPDALSNPYLVYALLIRAGLYGIKNRMELSEKTNEEGLLLPKSKKEAEELASKSDFVKEFVPDDLIGAYMGH